MDDESNIPKTMINVDVFGGRSLATKILFTAAAIGAMRPNSIQLQLSLLGRLASGRVIISTPIIPKKIAIKFIQRNGSTFNK